VGNPPSITIISGPVAAFCRNRPTDYRKASQSFLRKQKKELKPFSAGACTWQKILLRLQVCELCANGAQGVRAADCKKLAESPEGDFRHTEGLLQHFAATGQYILFLY